MIQKGSHRISHDEPRAASVCALAVERLIPVAVAGAAKEFGAESGVAVTQLPTRMHLPDDRWIYCWREHCWRKDLRFTKQASSIRSVSGTNALFTTENAASAEQEMA